MALLPSLMPPHVRGQPSFRGGFGASEGCPQGNGRQHRAPGPGRHPSAARNPWGRAAPTSQRPWPGAMTAWSWSPRTWPTTTNTRAGVSTAGRKSPPWAVSGEAGPSAGRVRTAGSGDGNRSRRRFLFSGFLSRLRCSGPGTLRSSLTLTKCGFYISLPTGSASSSSALFTILRETFMTRATLRIDGVSAYIRRHSCTCSGVRAGGHQCLLSSALARSKPAFIL